MRIVVRSGCAALLLACVAPSLAACGSDGSDPAAFGAESAASGAGEGPSGGAPLQATTTGSGGPRAANEAVSALEAETGRAWEALLDPRGGVNVLAGELAGARGPGESAEAASRRFVRARAALLGIDDAELAFDGERSTRDGGVIALFHRRAAGRRLAGSSFNMRFDGSGALREIHSDGWPVGIVLDTSATVTVDAQKIHARLDVDGARVVAMEPTWTRIGERAEPSFSVDVVIGEGAGGRRLTIDARDGKILADHDTAVHAEKIKTDARGVQRNLEVAVASGNIVSYDATARHSVRWCNGTHTCAEYVSTPEAVWPGPLVSAQANMRAVRDAWFHGFGRNGPDDLGESIISRVQYGPETGNASWQTNGSHARDKVAGWMTYTLPGGPDEYATSAALDLVGHEFTHGVVAFTLKLGTENYDPNDAEGAMRLFQAQSLNESLADVFGIWAKQWACGRGYSTGCGVLFHYDEMAFKRPFYVRDIANPRKEVGFSGPSSNNGNRQTGASQRDHWDDFLKDWKAGHSEVHDDAGIPTKAWYLAARGGKHPGSRIGPAKGIGTAAAWEIWHHAAFEVGAGPLTTWEAFATSTIAAAERKFGRDSDPWYAVACAWRAVGVGGDWGQCTPCKTKRGASASAGVTAKSITPRGVADGATCATLDAARSWRDAPLMARGKTICGRIAKGVSAWMRIDAEAGRPIAVDLMDPAGDADLVAVDASGRVVARSERVGAKAESVRILPSSSGPLYLQIRGVTDAEFDLRLGGEGGVNEDAADESSPVTEGEAEGASCMLPPRSDCTTEDESFCGADVCSWNGTRSCCRAPMPVTKVCYTDDDCGAGQICAQVQKVSDAAGATYSCVAAGAEACTK